ncbi:MAG: hypothetical protein JW910_06600 [Anaerolineae bacterium]|nr:hypothetical protein [Anaerolineae bacterium]
MSQAEAFARALGHVYWLGGSPCSGKSSIADLLAAEYGLRVYRCDDCLNVHMEQATPDAQPEMYAVARRAGDDLWLRPVAELLASEVRFYAEEFPLHVAALQALPRDVPVLAEGAALLPELVTPLLADPRRALWVVPTPEFQHHHYAQRPWIQGYLQACSDPDRAFAHWMGRDAGFAQHAAEGARARGFPVITVDGSRSIAENAAAVAAHWGLRAAR